jgi:hypothetical protein
MLQCDRGSSDRSSVAQQQVCVRAHSIGGSDHHEAAKEAFSSPLSSILQQRRKKVSTPEARSSDGRSGPLRGNFEKTASSDSIRAEIVFDEEESNLADNTKSQVEQPGNVNALPASLDLESAGVGKLYMPTYDASPEAPHSSIQLGNVVPSISFGRLAGGSDGANDIPASVEENVIERMKVCRLPMCCILPGVLKPVI